MKSLRQKFLFNSFALAILLCLCFFHSVNAQDEDSESVDVSALILKLDDVDPKVRERTEAAILKLEEKAIPELRNAIRHSSLEVKRRCVILFEKIELKQQSRIAEIFLAEDFDERELSKFEAWNSFFEFTQSNDVATRKMFLNMCDQIPSVFENYGIKGEQTAQALKQLARLILIPNKHPTAKSESIVLAYLFLVQQAEKVHVDSDEDLFSEVEILEAVSFFSTNQHAIVGKNSSNRKVVDRVVALWVKGKEPFESATDPSRLKLIFHTSNLDLIAELESEYESMEPATKLKYLDIVSRAFSTKDKSALKQTWELLEKPLADEAIVAESRFRKRPAEKVDVSIKLLAESKLAGLLRTSGENAEQIELDSVFGAYPLSLLQFSIIKKQIDRESLSRRVQARIEETNGVE